MIPEVTCQNCGHTELMTDSRLNPKLRDCPDCDDPQLEMEDLDANSGGVSDE